MTAIKLLTKFGASVMNYGVVDKNGNLVVPLLLTITRSTMKLERALLKANVQDPRISMHSITENFLVNICSQIIIVMAYVVYISEEGTSRGIFAVGNWIWLASGCTISNFWRIDACQIIRGLSLTVDLTAYNVSTWNVGCQGSILLYQRPLYHTIIVIINQK